MNLPCFLLLILGFVLGFVLLAYSRTRIAGVIVLLLAAVGVGCTVYREHKIGSHFSSITPGMSVAQVTALLGKPSEINDGTYAEYGHKIEAKSAAKSKLTQYWYYSVYRPHLWVVVFDANMKVENSHQETSP